ncbi:MAG TPA: hypothetical protein VGK49_00345, partial [Ilumatobacteraceae bacterium]
GLTLLLSSLRASAQTGSSELAAPQQAAFVDPTTLAALGQIDRKGVAPVTLNGKVETGVGQGSFIADPNVRNPYFAWGASFVPAYYPIPALTLSLFAKISQEITDSEIDTEPQQVLFYDLQVRCRYALGQIPKLGIDVFVEARLYLPTSLVSRYETLVIAPLGRFSLIRGFGPVVLGYSFSFRKNFHLYESPVLRPDGPTPSEYARALGTEDLRGSNVAIAGNNVSFSFSNTFFVSYVPISRLAISMYYGISQAFTYRRYEDDEFTSQYAEAGRGQRDTGFGGLEVWFRLDKRFSFSAGMFTAASPKTENNQSFRFPFYDFHSTALNLTTFYLDVTLTEFLGG